MAFAWAGVDGQQAAVEFTDPPVQGLTGGIYIPHS